MAEVNAELNQRLQAWLDENARILKDCTVDAYITVAHRWHTMPYEFKVVFYASDYLSKAESYTNMALALLLRELLAKLDIQVR